MLAGHAGYLTGSYRRYTKKQLAEQYLKGERMLTVQGDPDIGEIREQLDSTVKTLQETRNGQEKASSALSSVVIENQELKGQLDTMRAEIKQIQERQAALEATKARVHADPLYADLVTRLERMETELKKTKKVK